MNRLALYFDAPRQIAVREEPVPPINNGQILVQTLLSAISAGTEILVYRGEAPAGEPVDESIAALAGTFIFPLKYGYSTVGRVIATGSEADPSWQGKMVFSFHPHESYFTTTSCELIPVPEGIAEEDAVFLPNMETAVNFVMDGQPLIGERVAIFGQGIVGLLTTAVLVRFPLASLVTLDRYHLRREASLRLGAVASLDPTAPDVVNQLSSLLSDEGTQKGADVVYELSGATQALDMAISVAGFGGRIVIGSWYGQKQATLGLGGRFHRSRIKIISSQVTTVDPALTGRWDKARRFAVTWDMLRKIRPSQFITHSFDFNRAAEAYRLLDENPAGAIQVIFKY